MHKTPTKPEVVSYSLLFQKAHSHAKTVQQKCETHFYFKCISHFYQVFNLSSIKKLNERKRKKGYCSVCKGNEVYPKYIFNFFQ